MDWSLRHGELVPGNQGHQCLLRRSSLKSELPASQLFALRDHEYMMSPFVFLLSTR